MAEIYKKYNEKGQRICPMCSSPLDEKYPLEYCEHCIRDIDEAELDEFE
jgi:predicted amidophosphoribosyltransferase